jgi:hypothetical protein
MPELNLLRERMLSALDRQLISAARLAVLADLDPELLVRLIATAAPAGWSAAAGYKLSQALASLDDQALCLPPAFARRLAVTLRDRQLILFAGAGLSHLCPPAAEHGARLPLWRGLAEQVAQAFADEAVLPGDFTALPDFFDYLKALPRGQARIELALRAALDETRVVLSPAHRILGRLPWSEIWTTNFDTLLERAAQRVCVDGEREFFHIREHERAHVAFVLHLHGTVHNPHTLGTLDFRGWESANPKLLAYLRERLLNRTILFVGYGLGDPNLDQVLSWLRAVAQDAQVRMFGLFWHMAQVRVRQLDMRDRIEAVSFTREEQWHMAFSQIASTLRALETPAGGAAVHLAADSAAAGGHRHVAAMAPDVRSALTYALRDRDENVRRAAIHAMHNLAGQQGLIDQLLGALADPDAGVRTGAAAALRQVTRHAAGCVRVTDALPEAQAMADLRAALRPLADNPALMSVLLGALGGGQVRGALGQALRELAGQADVRAGLLALARDPQAPPATRCGALAALCVCERERGLAALDGAGGNGASRIICH